MMFVFFVMWLRLLVISSVVLFATSDREFPVLGGFDVVAYSFLEPGEMDVLGNPHHSYDLTTSTGTYTFCFTSESNLALFAADPWKYIPAFGGHCVYGVATQEWWEKEDLITGPIVPPACINTELWENINGVVYLNHCHAKSRFDTDPDKYIRQAEVRWINWYGSLQDGPMNTHCWVYGDTSQRGGPCSWRTRGSGGG